MGRRPDDRVNELDATLAATGDARASVPRISATDIAGVSAGAMVGRYKLGGLLGAGAMGVVWSARDTHLDRPVAIKLVHRTFTSSSEAAGRVLREARAMAKVSHRGVVAIHDAGEADGQLFIAMELVAGTTLGRMLGERDDSARRDWRRWLAVMVEAARGLAAAHAAGVVHRDFKPDNILVANDGRVCVGDFGVAQLSKAPTKRLTTERPVVSLDNLTTTGALIGTPAYMSPEQLRGEIADERSDQFSFCVALHEALYGERPFDVEVPADGDVLETLIAAIEHGKLRPPGDARVPRRIRDAILRGLAPEPAARWPSMTALIAALTPARRWRLAAALAIAAALVATAAVLIATRSPPRLERHVLFPVPLTAELAVSPDGDNVAIATGQSLVVRDIDSHETRFEVGGRFSQGLAFADADHVRVALAGTPKLASWNWRTSAVDTSRELPEGASWLHALPNGELVVRDSAEHELAIVTPAGRRPLAHTTRRLEQIAVSPDGTRIAYADGGQFTDRIVVVDPQGVELARSEPMLELTSLAWRDASHLLISTGLAVDPTIFELELGSGGFGERRVRYHASRGWFTWLLPARGKVLFVDRNPSFRAQILGDRNQELDPEKVGAAIGWTDDGRWLRWDRGTGSLGYEDEPLDRSIPAAIDGEPGNATRASSTVILSMRKPGGRELTAVALDRRARLWSKHVGEAILARCAGDRRPPCVVASQLEGQPVRVQTLDPETGAVGATVFEAPAVEDIAVSPEGDTFVVCDGTATLHIIDAATRAERTHTLTKLAPGTGARGAAFDPRGWLIVTGLFDMVRIDADGRESAVLSAQNEVPFEPRPSPDGSQILVMGRLFLPMLNELVER